MLAFVHLHKTGGTTILYVLRSSFGARHCEPWPWQARPQGIMDWQVPLSAGDLQRLRKIYPRLESIGGHCVQPHADLEDACPGLRYFTFMRDPFKMRAAMFQHGVRVVGRQNIVFEDWIQEDQSRNRCTRMLAGTEDVNEAIRVLQDKMRFVGLTERFDESMLVLNKLVASDRLNTMYRRMRVSSDTSVAQELLSSPRTREMLAEGNQADIALYQYVVEELYPTYRREYGDSLEKDVAQYSTSLAAYSHRTAKATSFEGARTRRLLVFRDLAPYNRRNVLLSVLKKHLIYEPARRFYQIVSPPRRDLAR